MMELERALDRYGGDMDRWPGDVRDAANMLIAESGEAARLVERQQRIDAIVTETVRPVPVDAALVGRIAAGMHGHEIAFRPTGRLAAFVGAAMVAFLVTGYAVGQVLPTSQGEDTIAGLMFGDSSVSLSDTGSSL